MAEQDSHDTSIFRSVTPFLSDRHFSNAGKLYIKIWNVLAGLLIIFGSCFYLYTSIFQILSGHHVLFL